MDLNPAPVCLSVRPAAHQATSVCQGHSETGPRDCGDASPGAHRSFISILDSGWSSPCGPTTSVMLEQLDADPAGKTPQSICWTPAPVWVPSLNKSASVKPVAPLQTARLGNRVTGAEPPGPPRLSLHNDAPLTSRAAAAHPGPKPGPKPGPGLGGYACCEQVPLTQ